MSAERSVDNLESSNSTIVLTPPAASSDPTEHADWLELVALSASDRDSSGQDLIAALKRSGSSDGLEDSDDEDPFDAQVEQEDDRLELIADAAFGQLETRERYLGEKYPFSLNGVLQAKEDARTTIYAFLTAITSLGWKNEDAPESAASLFELVSARALVGYLGGVETARAFDFGFPRANSPSAFRDAVNELCQQMGEGIGCNVSRPRVSQVKDSKLDVVAWIPFGDDRYNQLCVFGQCSTGTNWAGKINELQPVDFCKKWFKEQPAVNPLLAFFVPRHIEDEYWPEASIGDHRLVFDRLRIARLVDEIGDDIANRCASWTASIFD